MPIECIVPSCNSTYTADDKSVTFHRLPRHSKSRDLWLKAVNVSPTYVLQFVCSKHFTEADYYYSDSIKTLRPGVVPTIGLQPGETPNVPSCSSVQQASDTQASKEENVLHIVNFTYWGGGVQKIVLVDDDSTANNTLKPVDNSLYQNLQKQLDQKTNEIKALTEKYEEEKVASNKLRTSVNILNEIVRELERRVL